MTFQRILVTTDFSDAGNEALRVAAELASKVGAHLTLLCVQEDTISFADGVLPHKDHRAQLDLAPRVEAKLRETAANVGCSPDAYAIVADASPVEGILQYAQLNEIDLIVMATQGRSGLQRLLIGSTTERVVRHAHCAVLTVR